MHKEVTPRRILGAVLAALCGQAIAADSSLQVSVRVLPKHPAPLALAALPVPPGARPLTSHSFGASLHYSGDTGSAASFYGSQMPRLGYRLVSASRDGTEWVWETASVRVEMKMDRVLGLRPATRIVVRASSRRASGSRY